MKDLFSLGYYLHLTSAYAKIYAAQALKKSNISDITTYQFGILYLLTIEDGLYQRQFSKFLVKDRANVSRMLDILEKKELITRVKDETCKRKIKIFITDKGRHLVDSMANLHQSILKEIKLPLTPPEEQQLLFLLEKIRNNLETKITIQI